MPKGNAKSAAGCSPLWLLVAGPLLLLPSMSAQPRTKDDPALEYSVKAAFLLNFTKFIEWPPAQKGAPEAPFNICILGDDPFGQVLQQTIQGENVDGRSLVVKKVGRESTGVCSILYVNKSERALTTVLKNTGPDVLTVGEGEGFLRDGGMIAFVIENRRVRFSVSLGATRSSALKLSSRLLSVAKLMQD